MTLEENHHYNSKLILRLNHHYNSKLILRLDYLQILHLNQLLMKQLLLNTTNW